MLVTYRLSTMNNSPDMKTAQELELVSSTMSTLDVARKTSEPDVSQSPILVNAQGQARIVRKVSACFTMSFSPAMITQSSHCVNTIGLQFDRHMLPIVCILYVLSYLDRGNIGNAKTAGIQEELSLDDQDWTWVLQGFYISYVLFEWTQLFWKLFPAHIYVATLCFLSVSVLASLNLIIFIC